MDFPRPNKQSPGLFVALLCKAGLSIPYGKHEKIPMPFEVDEDYECQSVSKVTPFTYTDSEGNTIVYYCVQTVYLSNEYGEYAALDMDAIGLVIDVSQIENKRECTVNEYDAFLYEIENRSYLCWTLSPEINCVIEYSTDAVQELDVAHMAESVPQ